ncbi:MAG: DUF4112 domain-containing protein [Verrucomicrobiota bacterium]|nr:DUF4112 domain-containing protein [Verrucomicrobiota bacterium]
MPADPTPAKELEFELLSEKSEADQHKSAFPRLIALLMDDLFRVPGTRLRFGLNPILDLIPAVGDGAAALISGLSLFVAVRYRVPKAVIGRMGVNILLNALMGLIPGVGELFAAWFRPSHRNYQLIRTHIPAVGASPIGSRKRDWFLLLAMVAGLLLLFLFCASVGIYFSFRILHALFGG